MHRHPSDIIDVDIEGQADGDSVRVARTMPADLGMYLTTDEWNDFCTQVNLALQPFSAAKATNECKGAAGLFVFLLFIFVFVVATIPLFKTDSNRSYHYSDNCRYYGDCNSRSSGDSFEDIFQRMVTAMVIVMVLSVLISLVFLACAWHSNATMDTSLARVRRCCAQFSKKKPGMSVHVKIRPFTGNHNNDHAHHDHLRPIYYIEFRFAGRMRNARDLHRQRNHARNLVIPQATVQPRDKEIPIAAEVVGEAATNSLAENYVRLRDVEMEGDSSAILCSSSGIVNSPNDRSTMHLATLRQSTIQQRLSLLESVKDYVSETEYHQKRKAILDEI